MYGWTGFYHNRTESIATSTGNSQGGDRVDAPSNAVNTKGSWTNLGTPTTISYEYCLVNFSRSLLFASEVLVDLGLTVAGSVQTIAENLIFQGLKQLCMPALVQVPLPVHVPKSSQIVGRIQSTASKTGLIVGVIGFGAGPLGLPGFAKCIALGIQSASSRGVDLDTGGVANTKTGSFVVLNSAVPANVKAMFCMIGHGGDATRAVGASGTYDIAVGPVGSETVIMSNAPWAFNATDDSPQPEIGALWPCDVKSGTRLSARQQSANNTAGDRTFSLTVFGMV